MNRIRYCSWKKCGVFTNLGMLEVTNSWDIEKPANLKLVSWISEKHQQYHGHATGVADLLLISILNVDGTFGIGKESISALSHMCPFEVFFPSSTETSVEGLEGKFR